MQLFIFINVGRLFGWFNYSSIYLNTTRTRECTSDELCGCDGLVIKNITMRISCQKKFLFFINSNCFDKMPATDHSRAMGQGCDNVFKHLRLRTLVHTRSRSFPGRLPDSIKIKASRGSIPSPYKSICPQEYCDIFVTGLDSRELLSPPSKKVLPELPFTLPQQRLFPSV